MRLQLCEAQSEAAAQGGRRRLLWHLLLHISEPRLLHGRLRALGVL